jgi:hypothetical protein
MTAKKSKIKTDKSDKSVLFVYLQPTHKNFLKIHAKNHNLSLTQLVEAVLGKYVKDQTKKLLQDHE